VSREEVSHLFGGASFRSQLLLSSSPRRSSFCDGKRKIKRLNPRFRRFLMSKVLRVRSVRPRARELANQTANHLSISKVNNKI
jgi:hypothetical protein